MYNPVADLDSALWCEVNPRRCPCRGSGWLVSDYDTFHKCAVHGNGVPHPEFDEADEFDYEAHRVAMLRAAYTEFRKQAREAGYEGNFREAVEAGADGPTPQDLVDAAEGIAAHLQYEAREASARREGYGSDLERRLTEDGQREAMERRGFRT